MRQRPPEREREEAGQITADLTVDEVVTRFPAAARVFIRRRMPCVGCDLAHFETIAEVCRIYGQASRAVLAELREAARAGWRRS